MPLPPALAHLLDPAAYPLPTGAIQLIETHISWVLIAGDFAYKIKKPVNFGFLDFTTLAKRRFYCDEEIRLNRRLEPNLYLGVVIITKHGIDAGSNDGAAVLDWAVKMRAFPPAATLDHEANITARQIDAIAGRVASFHDAIADPPTARHPDTADAVLEPVYDSLRQIALLTAAQTDATGPASTSTPVSAPTAQLRRLTDWVEDSAQHLKAHFAARQAAGFVRECHGDLHLGNIAWHDDVPILFDAIEFNADLRHIDVISEVAFLFMDLVARAREPLAWRFLNRYLEHTGDYTGLIALPFYLVYRALVRAKVAALRASQGEATSVSEVMRYLDLAERLSRPQRPRLILMHGYSGAGKTWLSQQLLEALGAIRLRSDVERKRLFGLPALANSQQAVGNIYGAQAGQRTFTRLQSLAGTLLDAGFPVIVDATFLGRSQRMNFAQLAEAHGVDWRLVSLAIDETTLRQRITDRQARADDASEADLAVLESQIRHADPLNDPEIRHRILVTGSNDILSTIQALHEPLPTDQPDQRF
jgi:uncharacterized protein